jgi:hypothetical protein
MNRETDSLTITMFFQLVTPRRHAALKMEAEYFSEKLVSTCDGATTQNNLVIFAAVKISNFTTCIFMFISVPPKKNLR